MTIRYSNNYDPTKMSDEAFDRAIGVKRDIIPTGSMRGDNSMERNEEEPSFAGWMEASGIYPALTGTPKAEPSINEMSPELKKLLGWKKPTLPEKLLKFMGKK